MTAPVPGPEAPGPVGDMSTERQVEHGPRPAPGGSDRVRGQRRAIQSPSGLGTGFPADTFDALGEEDSPSRGGFTAAQQCRGKYPPKQGPGRREDPRGRVSSFGPESRGPGSRGPGDPGERL